MSHPLSHPVMEAGMSLAGRFAPVNRIHEHLCAFHCYSHDMTRQVEAHHYCSHLNEEVRQCVIYDSDRADARLIGVEYVISERLFKTLPEEEKVLWHSHAYEVTSGMLYCPRLPQTLENQEMAKFVSTYGKTWHTWQVDRGDVLPFGPPQLMMSFTGDGQLRSGIVKERDAVQGKDTQQVRKSREWIKAPSEKQEGADHWEKEGGQAWQVTMEQRTMKQVPPPTMAEDEGTGEEGEEGGPL